MKGRIVAAACLEVLHKLPEFPTYERLDSPEALASLQETSNQIDKARIADISLSEAQAQKIVGRLWPTESLLGATCGRPFFIETAEQASVVNEILAPEIWIQFNQDKHRWILQTWPEVVDRD